MPDFPKVIKVVPTDDFFVHIYFDDGCMKIYDANELIKKGVFTPLKDINVFKNTCCIILDTLAWDLDGDRDEWKCLDLDSLSLYYNCPTVVPPKFKKDYYNLISSVE